MEISGIFGTLIVIYIALDVVGNVFGFNAIQKITELISFGKSKQDKQSKLEDIEDSTPEGEFNILEIDSNTANAYFKDKASTEKQGYVINTENIPITIKNPIKINTPFRVFIKGFSREITGFLLKPDYELNPTAPEIKRFGDMKILKAFLAITKKHDETLQKITLILCAGLLIYVYKLRGDIGEIQTDLDLLLAHNGIPKP